MRARQIRLIPIVQQQLTMRMRIQSHPFSEQLKITKPVIFDMTLTPKQKDTFKLTITNTTPNPQKFKVQVNTATTNSNGIVDYKK